MVKGGEHKEIILFTLPQNSTHLGEENSSCVSSALLIKAHSSFHEGSTLQLSLQTKGPLS